VHRVHALLNTLRLETVIRPTKAWDGFYDTLNGVEYVIDRHLVYSADSNYGGDIRWMTVDTENNEAEVRFYDTGSDEEGVLTQTT